MNERKLAGMLGLAIRARQAAAGMDASRMMIRTGTCGVLLVDGDAGPNTRKKASDLCRQAGTPMMILPPGLIEKATGKGSMVIAIREGSFAGQFLQLKEGQPDSSSKIMNPESTKP